MVAIEAQNEKGWRWISAICRHRETAEAFLASVPPELRGFQRLVEIPHERYPLFVIEDRQFEYGKADLVRKRLAEPQPSGNEDAVLLNVYIVREDFVPQYPGRDSMGYLYHWHITDEALVPPRSHVIAEELLEAERDAV
ncbi:hypothetical protein [Ramlibacter albus]|uniref:Uncharacterized protein n=1 Tax=Ramlibacter albus TaxID=2079448 RepID=A0A923MES8_9BURK|nr:hypothetical protein [Ramlibacter albus]MBC5767954.1 hypothetical protein [Ramlibacter albus]